MMSFNSKFGNSDVNDDDDDDDGDDGDDDDGGDDDDVLSYFTGMRNYMFMGRRSLCTRFPDWPCS